VFSGHFNIFFFHSSSVIASGDCCFLLTVLGMWGWITAISEMGMGLLIDQGLLTD
jgi:hypothetical protein